MAIGWTEADVQDAEARLRDATDPRPLAEVAKTSKIPKPRMNGLETEYAQQLELDRRTGLISWWAFEPFNLRLAERTYYRPDFAVLRIACKTLDGVVLEFHECKGHWEEDARIKIKVAAEMYPFRFIAITKRKKRDGGGWNVEEFRGAVK